MKTSKITIRPATQSDLVRAEYLFNEPELLLASGKPMPVEYLEVYLDDRCFLVAEDKDEVIGVIFGEYLKGGGVFLWYLIVDKKYRGRGVGTQLLLQFEQKAKANGRAWMILYAPLHNEKTKHFYKKHHFTQGKDHAEFTKEIE